MLPPTLLAAIRTVADGARLKAIALELARISETYRAGGASSGAVDTAGAATAYLLARLPATYAAVARALEELAGAAPEFAPGSILDIGCGPGTAGFAALAAYPQAQRLMGVDQSSRFLALASRLASGAGMTAGRDIAYQSGDIACEIVASPADLVLASYTLVELDETALPALARRLWALTAGALVMVEPGSRAGFARLRAMREMLIASGASILAPCTHRNPCPMPDGDWCHFSVRLPRSREHQRVKSARVPFEDEKFSYLVAARSGTPAFDARIIAPVDHAKAGHRLTVCDASGIRERGISPREPDFKAARKWRWGDGL